MQSIELPLITKLGQKLYVLASFSSINDLSGNVQYYNVILTDITLKKDSEKDLMMIRSVFEASLDGIVLVSKSRIILVNDSFVHMFGYKSASEILGLNPLEFINSKDREKISSYIELTETGKDSPPRYNFTGRKRNDESLEIENSVSLYQIENEKFAVWILRDVTEEKKAQNALLISEERYRSISENINECIWTAERQDGKLKAVFYTLGWTILLTFLPLLVISWSQLSYLYQSWLDLLLYDHSISWGLSFAGWLHSWIPIQSKNVIPIVGIVLFCLPFP